MIIIKTCEAVLVLSVTRILRAALTNFRVYVCMYVCMCNYFSHTTEPLCTKIIPANRVSYADCYRLLRFEIFTPPYLKLPKNHFWGPVMLHQWEIEYSCKAHSKINRKIFAVYGSVPLKWRGSAQGWSFLWLGRRVTLFGEMSPQKPKRNGVAI